MGHFLGPPQKVTLVSSGIFGVPLSTPAGLWIKRTSFPLTNVQAVAGNATRMVVLDGAGAVAYSDDHGATWAMGSGLSLIDGQAVATNGSNLWLVSSSTGNIYASPDGATWTHTVDIGPLQGTPSIIFGSGLFMLCVQSSAQVVDCYTSSDGTTWTGQPTTIPNQLSVQLFDGVNFVASGQTAGGQPLIGASPIGAVWATTTVPQFNPRNNLINMAFHAGVYVATDQNFPSVIQSSLSPAWVGTNLTQPLTDSVIGVAFGEGVWCLAGSVTGGTIAQGATSTDLNTWSIEDLKLGVGSFQNVAGLVAAGGTLVAFTFNGILSTRS